MPVINLRDFYPELYSQDQNIEVSGEVAETLLAAKRKDTAGLRKLFYPTTKPTIPLTKATGLKTSPSKSRCRRGQF